MGDNKDHTEDPVISLLSHMTRIQDKENQSQAEMIRNQQQTLEMLIQPMGQQGQTKSSGSQGGDRVHAEDSRRGGRAHAEGSNTHIPSTKFPIDRKKEDS
jgi:hypothetical protein